MPELYDVEVKLAVIMTPVVVNGEIMLEQRFVPVPYFKDIILN